MIVVDASALIEVLLQTTAGTALEARLLASEVKLQAPHLIDVEVTQVVRRLVAAGAIPRRRGDEAIVDLADFPLRRYPHQGLLPRIWQLRGNLSAYDATYVALAEALDARLLTRDRRLADSPGLTAEIEVV
ncbi:MAG TPA: type II toxin-antitoxin system VapC family toxin [Caulobacteraceae bacterium]|nr:type II toxin-antitoxin system VapC family toxin [Caulobacteraceae bacterium]